MVLLATKGVLMRPWCLIELLEAARKQIPIVLVRIAGRGFDFDEARRHITNFEAEMGQIAPSALELLHEHVGQDLRELREACLTVLNAHARNAVVFDPHAGDNVMLAMMKDVVERMGTATSRKVVWKGGEETKLRVSRTSSNLCRMRTFCLRRPAVKKKRLGSIRVEDLMSPSNRPHFSRKESESSSPRMRLRGLSGARNLGNVMFAIMTSSKRRSCSRESIPEPLITNVESAVFICCSRRDGISHARGFPQCYSNRSVLHNGVSRVPKR